MQQQAKQDFDSVWRQICLLLATAGPQGMVRAAKQMVADINDARAKPSPYLHFHQVRSNHQASFCKENPELLLAARSCLPSWFSTNFCFTGDLGAMSTVAQHYASEGVQLRAQLVTPAGGASKWLGTRYPWAPAMLQWQGALQDARKAAHAD